MKATLAFDIYGTLIDTHGLLFMLHGMIGDRAQAFSQAWRDKQLEYSFRRGLMGRYADFGVCTRQALDFTSSAFAVELGEGQKEQLLQSYRKLPAFADVREGLDALRKQGFGLYAFSNGSAAAVATLLEAAGIDGLFRDIISVEDCTSFKPDPRVYGYFLQRTGSAADDAWLISSNPFDVIGAKSAGMHCAWLQRSAAVPFDPWEYQPDITVHSLSDLASAIAEYRTGGN